MSRLRTALALAGGLLLAALTLCVPVTPAVGLAAAASTAPTAEHLEPSSGPEAGGTPVTITGTGLTAETAVQFGATPATHVEFTSETEIVAISPPGSGAVEVTVTTGGGTSAASAGDTFTYAPPPPPPPPPPPVPPPAPTVEHLEPSSGPEEGGSSVTITGTNLTEETAVQFGSTPAARVEFMSASEIVAISPAGSGAVEVTATTAGGTSAASASDTFTYAPPSAGPGGEAEEPEEPFNLGAFLRQLELDGFAFPGAGGSSLGGASLSGPSGAAHAVARVARRQHGAGADGTVVVPAEDQGARLEVALLAQSVSPAGARPATRPLLGRLTIGSVRSGRVSFSVPLNARGRRALRRRGKLGLTMRIVLAPGHGTASVLTDDVLLSAPTHPRGRAPA